MLGERRGVVEHRRILDRLEPRRRQRLEPPAFARFVIDMFGVEAEIGPSALAHPEHRVLVGPVEPSGSDAAVEIGDTGARRSPSEHAVRGDRARQRPQERAAGRESPVEQQDSAARHAERGESELDAAPVAFYQGVGRGGEHVVVKRRALFRQPVGIASGRARLPLRGMRRVVVGRPVFRPVAVENRHAFAERHVDPASAFSFREEVPPPETRHSHEGHAPSRQPGPDAFPAFIGREEAVAVVAAALSRDHNDVPAVVKTGRLRAQRQDNLGEGFAVHFEIDIIDALRIAGRFRIGIAFVMAATASAGSAAPSSGRQTISSMEPMPFPSPALESACRFVASRFACRDAGSKVSRWAT